MSPPPKSLTGLRGVLRFLEVVSVVVLLYAGVMLIRMLAAYFHQQ